MNAPAPTTIESVLIGGDLARLSPEQRLSYYHKVCDSLQLNPLTMPFQYLNLNGKLVLYATKGATQQLARLRGISFSEPKIERFGDLYTVTVNCKDKDGRADCDMGAIDTKGLTGEKLANAMMKAITKAKRRAVLSICSLNMLDETEVETIPDAQVVPIPQKAIAQAPIIEPDGTVVDPTTGEVLEKLDSAEVDKAEVAKEALKSAFPNSVEGPKVTMENGDAEAWCFYKLPYNYPGVDMEKIRKQLRKMFGEDGYSYDKSTYVTAVTRKLDPEGKSSFPFADFEVAFDSEGKFPYVLPKSEARNEYFKWLKSQKKGGSSAAPKPAETQQQAVDQTIGDDQIPW